MHPPLDRPHPDCEDEVQQLKHCHATSGWAKYAGVCNPYKTAVDQCFRMEKARLMKEMAKELPGRKVRQEAIVQRAFGKQESFSEFLQKDPEYLAATKAKANMEQQSTQSEQST